MCTGGVSILKKINLYSPMANRLGKGSVLGLTELLVRRRVYNDSIS